jgi:two-component system phosphate regulon sensor histidine kinase PhoR
MNRMPPLAGRSLLITLVSALLAWPIGHFVTAWAGWLVFSLGLALQLTTHVRNFSRLERWSHAPGVDRNLESEGAWDDVFGRIYRHEKDLREQIAKRDREIALLIAATQALTDGFILLDQHNQIQFCNMTAEAQLGLKANVDIGASIVNLVRQPEFAAYLECGDHSRPLTLRLERQQDRVLSLHVLPYAGDRRLLQVKDVTQTDRLDSMRRDFVANVSHELRTPLTVLAGFLETLQEIDVAPEERRHYLGLMSEQSKRMQSIVQDLLTLSSIESAPPPANDLVDMDRLVAKLQRDAEALSAGRHSIVVETEGRGDLFGSEPELISAFGNLVANGVRYTPAGGTITLQWRVSAQGAEFAVTDTGIGIDPKHIPRLTERFYRVDRGRSRDAGGTGLGLAIVKHSLNRHQARLEITSTPGKGSRFTAHFPANRIAGISPQ